MPITWEKVQEAKEAIRQALAIEPAAGLILGTGLGDFARRIEGAREMPYRDIPNFPCSTVEGHAGQLVAGTVGGVPVVAMEGRIHLYEGYTAADVAFPVWVLKALGARALVATCACGALNHRHERGDLLIIEDHINLMGANPLIGPNDDRLGPRYPDMAEPYNHGFVACAEKIALSAGIRAHRGIYAAMSGPCLETRAEYRMLQRLGADAIGMSTVPEVIAAAHAGLQTLGVAVLTDMCLPDALRPCDIHEIVAVAKEAAPKLEKLLVGFLEELPRLLPRIFQS